jgi:hypothetical protein
MTNLIAMAAPGHGSGPYMREEIEYILKTAYTGFPAAFLTSDQLAVSVHTGFWGCGAFGGDRMVMTMLQALAARLADVNTLVFHTFDEAGLADVRDAEKWWSEHICRERGVLDMNEVIVQLVNARFRWGVSNGN